MRSYRRRVEKLEKAMANRNPTHSAPVDTSVLRSVPKAPTEGWIGRIEWPDGRVTYRFPVEGMRAKDV